MVRQIVYNITRLGRMWMGFLAERALEVLVPSWGEINVTLATAVLLVLLVSFLQHSFVEEHHIVFDKSKKRSVTGETEADGMKLTDSQIPGGNSAAIKSKEVSTKDLGSTSNYMIRMELLAAKNLVAANLNGTSDPYAIITCGEQKRFSSMVQGSRNPMWGEEFDLYVEDLPVEIKVSIYDWDIVWKSASLGSLTLLIQNEGQTEAIWHALNSVSGQVCLQTMTKRCSADLTGSLNGAIARRRFAVEKSIGTEVRQKPGPLQTIFRLPPDEVVLNSYSCALERSFLYHGRMFVSAWHICFHSNVFSKQLKVVLPYEDIEEIKRSQHAFINPAITMILRAGSGGHGVPPLASTDGRAKYKFASFWNRNHAHRALLKAARNFQTMQEAAKQEKKQSMLRTQSSSFSQLKEAADMATAGFEAEVAAPIAVDIKPVQPFLQEDVLVKIMQVDLPGSADEVLRLCFSGSEFTEAFRSIRKDTDLKIEAWQPTDEYRGEVRKITFRALCTNPMCPPDTAMTEYQHSCLSDDKKVLLFETVQQCHDVPFGSYFEVHVKWMFETTSDISCSLNVKVGAHFKKWCMMQGKIKAGTVKEGRDFFGFYKRSARNGSSDNYKGDAELIMSTCRIFLEKARVSESNSKSDELLETEAGNGTSGSGVPLGHNTGQKAQGSTLDLTSGES